MPTIEEYYEKYWDAPDDYHDPTTPERQALFRKHALPRLKSGDAILDLGCGRGEFCAFFAELGLKPQGIDISQTVIAHARKQHPGITFHAGEVQTLLPASAASFDCVFSSEVIEHLFDVMSYLEAVNNLLKPGGMFVLTTPYHGLVKNILLDTLNYAGHYDPLGQHIRFFDKKGLRMCLAKGGFEASVWTGYGRPWPLWKSFFVVSRKVREA